MEINTNLPMIDVGRGTDKNTENRHVDGANNSFLDAITGDLGHESNDGEQQPLKDDHGQNTAEPLIEKELSYSQRTLESSVAATAQDSEVENIDLMNFETIKAVEAAIVNTSQTQDPTNRAATSETLLHEQKWYATGKLSYRASEFAEGGSREVNIQAQQETTAPKAIASATKIEDSSSFENRRSASTPSGLAQLSQVEDSKEIKLDSLARKTFVTLPEYMKKKISVFERDDEFEIVVRDYSLSEQQKLEIVKVIESKLDNHGAKIKKFVINGKPGEELK